MKAFAVADEDALLTSGTGLTNHYGISKLENAMKTFWNFTWEFQILSLISHRGIVDFLGEL